MKLDKISKQFSDDMATILDKVTKFPHLKIDNIISGLHYHRDAFMHYINGGKLKVLLKEEITNLCTTFYDRMDIGIKHPFTHSMISIEAVDVDEPTFDKGIVYEVVPNEFTFSRRLISAFDRSVIYFDVTLTVPLIVTHIATDLNGRVFGYQREPTFLKDKQRWTTQGNPRFYLTQFTDVKNPELSLLKVSE